MGRHVAAIVVAAAAAAAVLGPFAVPGSALAAPTVDGLAIAAVTGTTAQHVDGSTVWIRPGSDGSFGVTVDSVSATHVEFPSLGSGWTPSGAQDVPGPSPFSLLYYWTGAADEPADPVIVTAWDDDPSSADAQFHVRFDGAAPTGSVLVAQSATTNDTSVPVSVVAGADTGSGIGGWQLRRRTSPLAGGACTNWTSWSSVGPADPVDPISDALVSQGCYQYGAVVSDNVGNDELLEQVGDLRVDRTIPDVATIDPIPAEQVRERGTVELTGLVHDGESGVRGVSVSVEDRYSICGSASVDATGRWRCTWEIAHGESAGGATIRVTAVDHAGNRSWATQAVVIQAVPNPFGPRIEELDSTPPTVALAPLAAVNWNGRTVLRPSARDDRGGFVEVHVERRARQARSAAYSPWRPVELETFEVALRRGETTCFRAIAIDDVGNRATSAARCATVPLDDRDLARTGRWTKVSQRKAWLGTLMRSSRRGATMAVRTADPTPQLVVGTCPACGSVRVYHGRKLLGTYSTRSRRAAYRRVLNLRRIAKPASAPLRIVSTTDRPVLIDGFVSGP